MALGQIVALAMVKKWMKFYKICFNTFEVIALKFKVFHNDNDNNDNDYNNNNDNDNNDNDYNDNNDNDYVAGEDTRVMKISRLFFF